MPIDPQNDPEFRGPSPKPEVPRKNGCLPVVTALIVIGVLAAGSMLAHHDARERAKRIWCSNNLKSIALALHNYQGAYGAFPPQYTVDDQGRPLHSWRTLILPFLDQQALYDSIDLSKPWNDPANAQAFAKPPPFYQCPLSQMKADPLNTATYLAIIAPGGWCLPDRPRRLEEFTDGSSDTLLLIEVGEESAVPWMAPIDADEATILSLGLNSKTVHDGGFNAAFADGRVKFLKASLPA
ncbi:MAG: DUF1559 domain-containing protein, partial [Isosphaeraceae bacterium]